MRGSAWIVVPVLVLLAAGCSPRPKTAEATPAGTAPPALVVETKPEADLPPAPATSAAAVEPQATPAPAPTAAPAPRAPPSEAPVRFSRDDFSAHEHRLAALIANAETRDTSGETQYRAEHGEAERQHCATRACIERSYAAEEAWLRQWEGSGDAR
ncbi:MAG TPA: hypothetical protein VFW13_12485 [Phenylobacterium sp.]|nr:hypothetical protein [Phenylobacterium sp.]